MKDTKKNKLFLFSAFVLAFFLATLILVVQRGIIQGQEEFVMNEPASRTVFSPVHVSFVDEEETARLREEKIAPILPVYTMNPKVKRSVTSNFEGAEIQEEMFRLLTLLSERFLNEGVLDDAAKKELMDSGRQKIHRYNPATEVGEEKEVKEILSLSEVKGKIGPVLDREKVKNQTLQNAVVEVFNQAIRPNLFFDETRTKEHLKAASDSVASVMEEVKRGEMIVQKGLLVDSKQLKRLMQVQKKMVEKEVRNRLFAIGIFVFLGLALSFLYLKQFQPKEFYSPRFITLVLSTLLMTLGIERISQIFPNSSLYLLPGSLAAVLLTILWGSSLGILGSLSITILSLPLTEFRLEIVLMLLLGSLISAFAARRVRKRIHFLKVGLAIGLMNVAVLVAFSLSQDWQFSEVLSLTQLAFANGFLTTTLAFFLVPLFESLFGLTTDITLLELSDLNHPLLKRMIVEAPGTYHHSLVVSTLAESACEAIGARALLARVGCYFHDIGKIARSEYFTENQTPQTSSRHEKLTPMMSSLVIMNHVKDGMELAKKYKLRDLIIRFIPEHQGTGVIYYFYKKALDQAAPGESVRADDFRYPGPKPQSRETAVALLADSTEAASRSLSQKELTPAGIRNLVRKIINEKFIDGQLDECDLTLKDLHKIQESFVHNLMAIFHTRVSYPAKEHDPNRPDIFGVDQFTKFRNP